MLLIVITASFVWSIHQTSINATAAYFSPFTRAWELAIGGLAATASPLFSKLSKGVSASLSWIGLTGILGAAFILSTTTPYPGTAVALPVLSTFLVIVGGTAVPPAGSETLLRLLPFRFFGKLSYSLYLWHWPVLIIAEQYAGHALTTEQNLLWVLVGLGLSAVSYFLIENPLRRARYLAKSPQKSIFFGLMLIGVSVGLLTLELASHS
jgi:peptidoglycan/LPS O-acetylase OafA/YrhL